MANMQKSGWKGDGDAQSEWTDGRVLWELIGRLSVEHAAEV